ncbi:MAG: cyanophycin synthetase, partial [Planctomycetota bacterium]
NCGVALAILDRLRAAGFECDERSVAIGLATTQRRGRAEQVWDEPRVVIDGAHTHESVRALVNALGATEKFDSLVAIFGCAADKNVEAMLDEVSRGADKVIFTAAQSNPRAMEPGELASMFEARNEKMSQIEPDVRTAINAAARAVGRDDIILVTGSFYLAGEAKALFDSKREEQREATRRGDHTRSHAGSA